MPQPKIDFAIGGQAVIEGVMMRSPHHIAIAVRKADGSIKVRTERFRSLADRIRFLKWPVLRGMLGLIEMMIVGIRALNFSANENLEDIEKNPEETQERDSDSSTARSARLSVGNDNSPSLANRNSQNNGKTSRNDKKSVPNTRKTAWIEGIMFAITIVFSLAFGIFLFKFVPLWITQFLSDTFSYIEQRYFLFNIIDGVMKTSIFILYVAIISLLPDIKRVFQYHGAEHKSVFTYEKGLALTLQNAAQQSRFHPRCGTSFILVVFLISIFVYTLLPNNTDFFVKFLQRLALLPLIAGISYEFLKLSARHQSKKWIAVLIAPGLMFQKMTTREPNEKQLEVALKAMEAALNLEKPG